MPMESAARARIRIKVDLRNRGAFYRQTTNIVVLDEIRCRPLTGARAPPSESFGNPRIFARDPAGMPFELRNQQEGCRHGSSGTDGKGGSGGSLPYVLNVERCCSNSVSAPN